MIRVFLAAEGRNELADRKGDEVYQTDRYHGVVEALLRQVRAEGWTVVGSIDWHHLHNLEVNAPGKGEARNVHRAHWKARKANADVLVFVRDRDRKRATQRNVEEAIVDAEASGVLPIVGGVAIETLEGWLFAITGKAGSESIRRPADEIASLGLRKKHTADYVAHIEKHGLSRIPDDAQSLKRWIARAQRALGVPSSKG